MSSPPTYLDYNASTPCAPEVVEAMLPFFCANYANPASTHILGCSASKAVEKARVNIGDALGVSPEDLVFTSGATESNCLVLLGLIAEKFSPRARVVVGAGEHQSVLEPSALLLKEKFDVCYLPLEKSGIVDIEEAERLITDDTLIVSLQGANNETGVIQPLWDVVEIAKDRGALVHCDATQLLGKVPMALEELRVDFASVSAHKVYGPKGVGACYIGGRSSRRLVEPILKGGGQEFGLRSGTLNVPGIIGFGEACRLAQMLISEDPTEVRRLRDQFEVGIRQKVPDVVVVGEQSPRLPGTSCVIFPGVSADVIMAQCRDLCMSSGSACASGTVSPSHVLLACGYSRDLARCAVRISLGRYSTQDDVERAVARISECVHSVREEFSAKSLSKTAGLKNDL